MRTVRATRYVTPLREGGSLPGLVEADDDGLYVLKFRGAGQGPKALVAELIVGELGRALGLPVPEIVLVDLDPSLGDAEPDEEIQDLVRGSGGVNLGLDFLPGSLPFNPAVGPPPLADFAADVVWFDALTTNPDRSAQNPNIIVWHRSPWLIDHGAALYVHHRWQDPEGHARRPFERIADHVLLPFAGSIVAADDRLVGRITADLLGSIASLVPAQWLAHESAMGDAAAQRAAYVAYLSRRLVGPRVFVVEADGARAV